MAEMIDEVVYLFNISTTLAHFRFSFFLHVWATNKMLLYLSNEWPDVLIGPVSFFYFFRFPLPFFFSLTLRCGRPFLFWKGGKKAAQEGGVGSKSFDVAYCSSRLGNSKKGRYTHTSGCSLSLLAKKMASLLLCMCLFSSMFFNAAACWLGCAMFIFLQRPRPIFCIYTHTHTHTQHIYI